MRLIPQTSHKIDHETYSIADDLKPASEFFCDPTLFSLLRVHRESQVPALNDKKSRSESMIRETEESSTDINPEAHTKKKGIKKSQAKDVMPGRLLDEEDEILDIQDPHVPKKRQYLASDRKPAILLNAKKARLQSNENDSNNSSESTGVNDADLPSGILEHAPSPLKEFDSGSITPMNVELESPSSSGTPLALPPTSSRPVTYVATEEFASQDDDGSSSDYDSEMNNEEDNEAGQSEGEAEDNSLEAPPDDPRIAKTTLETRYLEMANLLDSSPLATLR
jgi:hypothetical protein